MSNRILSVKFKGIENFENGEFVVEFTNKQNARGEEGELSFLFGSVYTNNLIALAGANSSGKTTAARLLAWAAGIISTGNINLDVFDGYAYGFMDILKENIEIEIIAYSFTQKKIFMYCASIKNSNNQKLSIINDYIKYKNNGGLSLKHLFDFQNSTTITRNEIINRFEIKSNQSDVISNKLNIESDECIFKYTNFYYKTKTIFTVTNELGINLNKRLGNIPPNLINYLDSSVEYLNKKNNENSKIISYDLKFKGREAKEIEEFYLDSKLSAGTVRWIRLFKSVVSILKYGGYFIIDEIEQGIHKALAVDIIKLFSSKVTNKLGATLIFTTHYSELLDCIKRNDSIYITSKQINGYSKITNLSKLLKRNDKQKSDSYLKNMLSETTAPNREIFNMLVKSISTNDEEINED
ncbi:MAG: ATP-binding protein [Acholeplasmatales bacterium]|nr:ATP-binding protein [Acholeplasmatales bacterium]